MTPIFELKNVCKSFGKVTALDGINLTIMPTERVAIVGPSGAGKTTLLNLLNGSIRPDAGEVRVLGQNLTTLSRKQLRHIQRQIGTVYQQFHLVEPLRVIHNINAGHLGHWSATKALFSLIKPLAVAQAQEALVQVGIPEKLYAQTSHLSGGQKQRVALARVLVQNPQAILADEPISNLDPRRRHEIMDLIRRLVDQTGKTLILNLHSIEFAYTHCHRIIGLRHGRIQFDDVPERISEQHVHELYRLETL
ncbi:MAG: ATP-binding cassette domain-containing protein [Gemmatimonadetes bacterium]|nr:MAG: ATP-binding cassette domain-containing protein [Gemmatimonadota bacterium]